MNFQRNLTLLALTFMLLSITACSATGISDNTQDFDFKTIHCEVFYRSKAGLPLEPAPVTPLEEHNDQLVIEFEDMVFEARYQVDKFEGRALTISVSELGSGTEINRVLYQFDDQNPPENQFIGGHGFTGLNYLYHPNSSAEMQYFCSVQ